MNEILAKLGDLTSLGVLIGYFIGALPTIATLATLVWTVLRIYEMETVQKWLKRKHNQI